MADHLDGITHDRINRYLRGEKLTSRLLWDNVKNSVEPSETAYLLFDDTVLDQRYSPAISLTRRQYSCNEHNRHSWHWVDFSCVYVNAETGQFWVIDYRLYDPDGDSQSKLADVAAMLSSVVYSAVFLGGIIPPKINLKQLSVATVLMDSWDATQKLLALIDQLEKVYSCPQRVASTGR